MKKEHYRLHLPHFHTPGQQFFVTWCLKESVSAKAFEEYSLKLNGLRAQIRHLKDKKANPEKIAAASKEYYAWRTKYFNAFNKMLDAQKFPEVNISKKEHTKTIIGSLNFWCEKKIKNIAFSIMPNHVHWVLETYEKDFEGNPVYLQDILKSIKQFTSGKINKVENLSGTLWHKESFDVTIRDDLHLSNVISYTLNNPVKAGFVKHWTQWPGNWCRGDYVNCF